MVSKIIRWIHIWIAQFYACRHDKRADTYSQDAIVVKLDAIGDFIIWLDAARGFREAFSNKRLILICNSICEQIAEASGYFNEIVTVDIKRFEGDFRYQKRLLNEFRQYSCDTLIQAAHSRTIHMDMIASCISAKEKIGFVADESRDNLSRCITFKYNRRRLDGIYDELIELQADITMEISKNAWLVNSVSDLTFHSSRPVLTMDAELGLDIGDYIVFFMGASAYKRMWGTDSFAILADRLFAEYGLKILCCGTKGESYLFAEIVNDLNSEYLINYCGKTTLPELVALVRDARLVVSNDTSGMHIAAAVDTPVVAIVPDKAYGRFFPYKYDDIDTNPCRMMICHADMPCKGCVNSSITKSCKKSMRTSKKMECIVKISVDEVLDSCKMMIDKVSK